MDGTRIMVQQRRGALPGGLLFGLIASSGLWLALAEFRHFL